MKTKISDMLDNIEYYPRSVNEVEPISTQRVKEITMRNINKTKAVEYSHAPRRVRRRFSSVAIAAMLVIALPAAIFAAYNFGLKDLAGSVRQIDGESVHTLSLNGLKESPEYKAAQEWESHLAKWYEEDKNLLTVDNIPDESDMYAYNGAFSQEAKDTLDSILAKYGLKLHTSYTQLDSVDELYAGLGIKGFMPAAGNNGEYPIGGSCYEDGTFAFNSSAVLPDGVNVRYQSYRFVKGAFTRVGHLLADANDFEEWTYANANGIDVRLAISANKSVIAADLDNSFVFVNVLSGKQNSDANRNSYGEETITKVDLEALADGFNFAALK